MQKNREMIKKITTTAMLVAISAVIGIFCKTFMNYGDGLLRITFENLPIIMAGILYGPIIGAVVGVATDIVSYFASGQAFPMVPLVTFGCGMIGATAGIISKYVIKTKGTVQIAFSGIFAHVIGSMIIKTIGLYQFYGVLVLLRIPTYIVIGIIETMLLCILLNRKSFASVVGYNTKPKMTYNQALDYIHSVSWTFCKPGLERIDTLCKRLGNPQNNLKFIHVAGTNGKGSFCSMLSSVLIKAGYRVGTFTSPYVKCFNERMKFNGKDITNEELVRVTEIVKPIADSMKDKPTEFELITAVAFEYFKRKKCDYVVLECGLGGRLDSTNIIENSVLSVITGIALDHTSILGNTIPEIAKEKAGIIKSGTPVLWCGDSREAKEVIYKTAKEKNAPFYEAQRSSVKIKKQTLDGTLFDFKELSDLEITLLGSYQVENAVNVLSAVEILNSCGILVSNEAICEGLASAKWHARFELISNDPVVIFDGGHNPQGVTQSIESVKAYFENEKLYVITGVMADKDYNFIASKISEVCERAFCITPDNQRALNSTEYANVYKDLGTKANSYETVNDAVKDAIELARKNNKKILCLGSLYMYAEVLDFVNKYKNV